MFEVLAPLPIEADTTMAFGDTSMVPLPVTETTWGPGAAKQRCVVWAPRLELGGGAVTAPLDMTPTGAPMPLS